MAERPPYDRENIPKAYSFDICKCADPNCGPHVIAVDANGKPMAEIVMSKMSTMGAIATMLDIVNGGIE